MTWRRATVYRRCAGLALDCDGRPHARKSSASSVSKALRRIEQLGLIARTRAGNRSKVTLLDEGGCGESYAHPGARGQQYFKLPHAYWTQEWHRHLSMPGKAVLLIALSLSDGFILPLEKGPAWYGMSADTLQRGLEQLRDASLLDMVVVPKKAPLAPLGYSLDRRYTLRPPFGPVFSPITTALEISA